MPDTDLTLTQLAKKIGTTKRTILRWVEQFDDTPSGRDPEAWLAFMRSKGLGAFSVRQNAVIAETTPSGDEERRLRLSERKIRVERELIELHERKGSLVPLEPIMGAFGRVVADFSTGLRQLPDRCARKLKLRVRVYCMRYIRTAYPNQKPAFFEKLEATIDADPLDYADVIDTIEKEVDLLRESLVSKCDEIGAKFGAEVTKFDQDARTAVGLPAEMEAPASTITE